MTTFVLDEGVDKVIFEALINNGFSSKYIAELYPGIKDDEVLNIANKSKSILITADKDFGELVFRKGFLNQGIILLRLSGLKPEEKSKIFINFISNHLEEIRHSFSVISKNSIRIRKPFLKI